MASGVSGVYILNVQQNVVVELRLKNVTVLSLKMEESHARERGLTVDHVMNKNVKRNARTWFEVIDVRWSCQLPTMHVHYHIFIRITLGNK